jgi:hypothetical protein
VLTADYLLTRIVEVGGSPGRVACSGSGTASMAASAS